jgi:hypothetical protein
MIKEKLPKLPWPEPDNHVEWAAIRDVVAVKVKLDISASPASKAVVRNWLASNTAKRCEPKQPKQRSIVEKAASYFNLDPADYMAKLKEAVK